MSLLGHLLQMSVRDATIGIVGHLIDVQVDVLKEEEMSVK